MIPKIHKLSTTGGVGNTPQPSRDFKQPFVLCPVIYLPHSVPFPLPDFSPYIKPKVTSSPSLFTLSSYFSPSNNSSEGGDFTPFSLFGKSTPFSLASFILSFSFSAQASFKAS